MSMKLFDLGQVWFGSGVQNSIKDQGRLSHGYLSSLAQEDLMFTFDKANRRARNMFEMMDRLGLDTETFAHRRLGLDLSAAVRICQFCIADNVCHDWLARAVKPVANAPAFCLNAIVFEQARD